MKFTGYVGFVENGPYFEEFIDTYGKARSMDVFQRRKHACERFQDVRAVSIEIIPAKPTRGLSRIKRRAEGLDASNL